MDFLPQALDLRVEVRDLFEQKAAQLANRVRQARVRILERRRQAVDMSGPLAATTPNSARWPRSALIVWVRWRTNRSRVLNSIPRPCCSAVLTATKFIVGRDAASQIASASAASFF